MPTSAAHDSIFKDEHPRLASPPRLATRENLDSRRGSRFGALSPDTRRLFAGRAVVRAAPLISRRPSSTDFSRRRSRTKTTSIEPPVTVRLDFRDPGYLSSRSHDGLRRLVIRAPETQLNVSCKIPEYCRSGRGKTRDPRSAANDGCDSIDSPRFDSVLDFCCHATRGRIREQWPSSSMNPLFFLRLFTGEGLDVERSPVSLQNGSGRLRRRRGWPSRCRDDRAPTTLSPHAGCRHAGSHPGRISG